MRRERQVNFSVLTVSAMLCVGLRFFDLARSLWFVTLHLLTSVITRRPRQPQHH